VASCPVRAISVNSAIPPDTLPATFANMDVPYPVTLMSSYPPRYALVKIGPVNYYGIYKH
jgi:hypothetical protein